MKHLFLSALISGLMLTPLCEAKTPRQPAKPVCASGKLIATFDEAGPATRDYRYYRCLLKQNASGYQVQDFYWPSGKRQSDPLVLTSKKDLQAWDLDGSDATGEITLWHENGQKAAIQHFLNGQANGQWVSWHENGQKEMEVQLVNGNPTGAWQAWHENGQKAGEGSFNANGEETGPRVEWYENGQKKIEGTYNANGQKTGTWTQWHDNGQKEAESRYNADGQETGTWTQWYKNGQKQLEGHYANGQENGSWTEWGYNGQKELEGYFTNGKESGTLTLWHENGRKALAGQYNADNQKTGKWTEWADDGSKEKETVYKNGEVISQKYWDKNGKQIEAPEVTAASDQVTSAPVTGKLPKECETYLNSISACVKKVGGNNAQSREAFEKGMEMTRSSLASMEDRAQAREICIEAYKAFKDATKQHGC